MVKEKPEIEKAMIVKLFDGLRKRYPDVGGLLGIELSSSGKLHYHVCLLDYGDERVWSGGKRLADNTLFSSKMSEVDKYIILRWSKLNKKHFNVTKVPMSLVDIRYLDDSDTNELPKKLANYFVKDTQNEFPRGYAIVQKWWRWVNKAAIRYKKSNLLAA